MNGVLLVIHMKDTSGGEFETQSSKLEALQSNGNYIVIYVV